MRFIRATGNNVDRFFGEQPCRRGVDRAAGIPFNLLSPKVLVISRACPAPFHEFSYQPGNSAALLFRPPRS